MSSTDLSAVAPTRRPPGVVAVAVLLGLQGLLLVVAGVAVIAERDDATVQADFEAGTTGLTVSGGLVAAIGIASLAVAIGLLRRSSLARSVCTIVAVIQAATSVYGLVSLEGIRAGSVWSFASATVVLWFLYGSERTQAYFER